MNSFSIRITALALVLCAAPLNAIRADTPSADYLFPAGGQRGSTVHFRVGANFLHGGAAFEMHGDGVAASDRIEETHTQVFAGPMIFKPASQKAENYPRDHKGQVVIEPGASLGARYWRVRTSQGVTASRPFIIGDLPEIIEGEIDGRPLPVEVDVNLTINGRIYPREDVDIWSFVASAGSSYRCDVLANQIQSPLDSLIQIFDPDGRLVAENDDSERSSDSELTFKAQQAGPYRIHIFDSQFRGLQNYVYRLTIRESPFVTRVFPIGARAGKETTLQLFGPGLLTETTSLVPSTLHEGLRQVAVRLPDQSFTQPLRLNLNELNEFRYSSDAAPVADSFIANGQLDTTQATHEWTWNPAQGKKYRLDLVADSTAALLKLSVEDADGKTLATFTPDRSRPQPATLSCQGVGQPLKIRIEQLNSHDNRRAYRLTCRAQEPGFKLRLDTDALTLYRGQQAQLKVHVDRTQFKGEIKLRVTGLAADSNVTTDEAKIAANKPTGVIKLTAAADARVQPLRLRIVGEAEIDGRHVTQTATLPSPLAQRDRDEVVLGVSMPTPFTLDGVAFETRYGARGTVFRRHYVVHRNGFEGPLDVRLADRQIRHLQGVTASTMTVPPGKSKFDFPIRIPTWLEMNRTSRTVVVAVGKLKDEAGAEHQVSFTSGAPKDQIILLTAPCPIAIKSQRKSVQVERGQTIELPFTLDRGLLKPAAAMIELVTPDHFQGVDATPIELAAGETSGVLRVRIGGEASNLNMPVTIRAEMPNGNGDTVIAETKIELTQ